MKTFGITLKGVGLRTSKEQSPNSPGLVDCLNLRPYPEGNRPFEDIGEPFKDIFPAANMNFPSPQIFKGYEKVLLVDSDAIYEVEDNLELIPLTTYDLTGAVERGIVPGGAWHFIDLQTAWMLFNGSCVVFKDNSTFGGSNPIKVATEVVIGTGCEFRGQVITAGFVKGGVWQSGMKTILNAYRDSIPDEFDSAGYEFEENFAIWSSIGVSDLAFRWLLYPTEATSGYLASGGFDSDKTLLSDAIKRNQFGIMPLPFKGKIHVTRALRGEKSLGSGQVIVYGEEGIAALIPHTSPVPTFGRHLISDIGVIGRGAVGGTDDFHLFVDKNGSLCQITPGQFGPELKVLGYKEFFAGDPNWVISQNYNNEEREWYICSGSKGYVLTRHGLGRINQFITSTILLKGNLYCLARSGGESGTLIVTDRLDFKTKGIKGIEDIEIDTDDVEDLSVACDYRYEIGDGYLRSDFLPINERGIGRIGISAPDMRIVVGHKGSRSSINDLKVWFQNFDLRAYRGIDVTEGGG